MTEQLIRDAARVKDLGEVLTPAWTVRDMLDALPADAWTDPNYRFLEPACGDGNFLVAVLARLLDQVTVNYRTGVYGRDADMHDRTFRYYGLRTLARVYGIDISADNIVGGPDVKNPARTRMLTVFRGWLEANTEHKHNPRLVVDKTARWILGANLIVGDMVNRPSDVIVHDYEWDDTRRHVTVTATTMADVRRQADYDAGLTMFGPHPARDVWSGPAESLHLAGKDQDK